jgi:hypothetical protein
MTPPLGRGFYFTLKLRGVCIRNMRSRFYNWNGAWLHERTCPMESKFLISYHMESA